MNEVLTTCISTRHPLHHAVGAALGSICYPSNTRLLLDPACGGRQNIPLFMANSASNSTERCNVDALVVQADRLRVILEIEEANIKPTQICGKFLATALSLFHLHPNLDAVALAFDPATHFVQVVDVSRLKRDRTSKLEQLRLIESRINALLPLRGTSIATNKLLAVSGSEDIQGIQAVTQCVASCVAQQHTGAAGADAIKSAGGSALT